MIQKNWKLLLITSVILLLPILAGLFLWDQLPAQVPSHWNAAGEVDGWCSKTFFVFGFPLIMVGFQWLCTLGTLADPKKQNHSGKILTLLHWVIPLISTILHILIYATILGSAVRMETVMPVIIGLLLTIVGNYLPKCKQNYTIGIKLPWTLNSEENWNKTHRFAGKLWVVCGIVLMATGFIGGFWVFLSIIILMVLLPLLYSYILHYKGI